MFKTSSFIKNNLIKTSITRDKAKKKKIPMEFLNRGPSDLTSDALPTELSRLHESFEAIWVLYIYDFQVWPHNTKSFHDWCNGG